MKKSETNSNISLPKSNEDSSNEDEESKPSKFDETMHIPRDIITLKKNLSNEEEFRSISQSESIHIFLKVKPTSIQEIVKQKDEV